MDTDSNAFVEPGGGNLAEVRRLVHRIVDLTLEARASAVARPPMAGAAHLPVRPDLPVEARAEDDIVDDLRALIESSALPSHPDFVAHMGAVSSLMSPVGDFVASCINNNLIGLELSPAFSLLEREVLRRLAAGFVLGPAAGGVVTTGGSLSNLHALIVARNSVLGTRDRGVHGLDGPPVFFASEAAHASITKAAMIAGLGSDGAIAVRTDSEGRMDVDDLRTRRIEAIDAGRRPFAVVATAGTTVTGSIDPIAELGAFAHAHGLWFHVDAAWGGGLWFSSRHRERLHGLSEADSMTFCPQKLLLVGLSSSVVLFRDMDGMASCFRTTFPYVDRKESFVNLCEISVQGSRPAEILKLWLTLQHVGTARYCEWIARWVDFAEAVAREVGRRPFLRTACAPQSGIVCFRGVPDWVVPERWDEWNAALRDAVWSASGIQLSFVPYGEARWLRAVFANPFTEPSIVERLFAVVDDHVARFHA